MPFVIDNIEFKQGSPNVVRFRIVPSDREIQYGSGSFQYIEVSLSSDLDLKEAIAVAAESFGRGDALKFKLADCRDIGKAK